MARDRVDTQLPTMRPSGRRKHAAISLCLNCARINACGEACRARLVCSYGDSVNGVY